MTNAGDAAALLNVIRQREQAATPGPWWCDEDDRVWRLHGVHAVIPEQADGLIPEQVMNHQILKAPKKGTPYAEYWPGKADAEFIIAARTDIPRLLAAVEAVMESHRAEPLYQHADEGECGCPVPGAEADVADDVWYDGMHPEGTGPLGTGLVCMQKPAVGAWCPGCADIAAGHGCFTVPGDYPAAECPVRKAVSRALLGGPA